jgi:hypothetical protein
MNGDRIAMSQGERDRLKVMVPVREGKRTLVEAARLMGLCVRQVRRLLRRLETEGDRAVVHGLRGRPSNRRREETFRLQVVAACRGELAALGPTMAAEKLSAQGLAVPKKMTFPPKTVPRGMRVFDDLKGRKELSNEEAQRAADWGEVA